MTDQSVTILGAGIVGLCCALSLQARGVQVRLIDRGAPGQETSFGNAGVISPWSVVPQAVPGIWRQIPGLLLRRTGPLTVRPAFWPRMVPWGLRFLRQSGLPRVRAVSDAMEVLCAPSVDLYKRHLQGTGHEALVRDCAYVLAHRRADGPDLTALDAVLRREKGAQMEVLDAAALRTLEPALSPEFRAAMVVHGQARALSPGTIGTVFAEKALAQGAEIMRAEVQRIARAEAGGWHLRTADGDLHADRVILAAGVWSAELLKPLGISVPLVAERGYHVSFPNAGVALSNSVADVDNRIIASSMVDGVRIAGSSEFGAIEAPPDPRKTALLQAQAHAMLPDLSPEGLQSWMGRRPALPDSLPALGPVPDQPGLFAAFGHCHYGLMMAPKTGELLADLLTARHPNADVSAYRLERFSE